MGSGPHRNRLARSSSPYLLQHAGNPVDWYPWGEDAIERARREDRPILLSIGYSACHWCHVMERESFEDPEIARLLNERFVSIKVDREERPDLDEIYMAAVQLLTGSGGWPLNVFLTPALKPFFGGTYFPPRDGFGRPSFRRVLEVTAQAYADRRGDVVTSSEVLAETIRASMAPPDRRAQLTRQPLDSAIARLGAEFDPLHGGFGGAPKFPPSAALRLLLRYHRKTGSSESGTMAARTLDAMASGGIHDHVGGGFHRYSVDGEWLVPHFEKMLYDNALLALTYLEAYQALGARRYAAVARDTLDFVVREMRDGAGGFFSAQDADSDGEEGAYYLWSRAELGKLLSVEQTELAARIFGLAEAGGSDGRGVLHLVRRDGTGLEEDARDAATLRPLLLEARRRRTPPTTDDKVLADWNGLAITALARAARVLGDRGYEEAAASAARFVIESMGGTGGLRHAYRNGTAHTPAFLDDHAFMLEGLVELHQTTLDREWLEQALVLGDTMIASFSSSPAGGLSLTSAEHAHLLARPSRPHDGATPSGNAVAALALDRLGKLTGRPALEERARQGLEAHQAVAERSPTAMATHLLAVDAVLGPTRLVTVTGPPSDETVRLMLSTLGRAWLPDTVVLRCDGDVGAQVCEGGSCRALATTDDALRRALGLD